MFLRRLAPLPRVQRRLVLLLQALWRPAGLAHPPVLVRHMHPALSRKRGGMQVDDKMDFAWQ